jgi:hypothetical protein
MMRGRDPTAMLGRALAASAARAGTPIRLADGTETPWHSATFSGARHAFAATAPDGAGITTWLATIGQIELPLSGHLLADLAVTDQAVREGTRHFHIEALTVARA